MSNLCADKIGRNAVTCIEEALRNCALLASDIEKKGNTMSWDGHVFVYHTSQQDKEHFYGRVPVQVKGTSKGCIDKEEAQETASIDDLKNYLKDGGAIYFYVYMSEIEHEIYYTNLLPYDLKKLLQNSNMKKRLKINLQKFPVGNINEITNIFMSFISNREKQAEFACDELYSLEELEKKGVAIENIGFCITGIGIDHTNLEEYVTTHSIYIYAEIKGIKRYIPVEKASNIAISRSIHAPIKINEILYYSDYVVKFWKGKQTILFGKSFSFVTLEGDSVTLSVEIAGALTQRIHDFEFLLELSEQRKFSINGAEIALNSFSLSEQEVVKHRRRLERLKLIKRTLDELDVQEELDISRIEKNDERNLDTLISAIIDKEDVELISTNNDEVVTSGFFVVSNLSILIVCHQSKNCKQKYTVCSYTKPSQIKITYANDAGEFEIIGSQYLLLTKDHFARASNLNYDVAFNSLTSYGNDSVLVDRINNSMLEVLKAYDSTGKVALLDFAERLVVWIKTNRINPESQQEIDTFNHLQITKRKRCLEPQELAELLLIKKTSKDARFLCATCILLDEAEEAKLHFLELPVEIQREFIEYPICKFWSIKDDVMGFLCETISQ